MRKALLLYTAVCLVAGIGSSVVQAAGMHREKPTPTPSRQETVIEKVTPTSITVATQTVAGNGKTVLASASKTYGITKFTEITVNGQRATADQLRPKMKVSVTMGMDPSQAARIVANG